VPLLGHRALEKRPGRLGEAVHEEGLKTLGVSRVLGSSSARAAFRRHAVPDLSCAARLKLAGTPRSAGCADGGEPWQTGVVTDDKDVRVQLEKLGEIERRANELMERPHYHMHEGKAVFDPVSGEPLRDDGPLLKGLEVAQRVLELRAQLLSLYAPQRHHLVDENGNTIDITRLIPMLRRLGIVVDAEE
jgi:hypothetical protein